MRKLMPCFGLALAVTFITACGNATKPQPQTTSSHAQQTPSVVVTTVQSLELNRQIRLPGELQAYQDVALYAKVPGFVQTISVDRGSVVSQGQLLATLRAPELDTQLQEAEAR
ncbi:MAG: biotin/lipoyl-binding protein, partial [Blastocatellia bacterium]